MTQTKSTVREIARGLRSAKPIEIEWCGVDDAGTLFGLSRPRIFKAIALNQIDSIHLRDPGNVKGIRLLNVSSIRSYLNSFREPAAAK
jgi:hypothetical protein